MNKTLLIRKGSYNYRAAQNLSRTVSHESGTELKRSKTWTEKTFGEPQDSSMRNAIFTLVATSMETGCLSLPIVLRYAGLLPGIVIILLSGIAAYYGMNGISLAAERRNTFNYSELVHDLLGKVSFYIEHRDVFRPHPGILLIFFSCRLPVNVQ